MRRPTNEEVVDSMFMILHLELALQKMESVADSSNQYFWKHDLRKKGNIFLSELKKKMDIYLSDDTEAFDQFMNLKQYFRDLNFQAIEELNKAAKDEQQPQESEQDANQQSIQQPPGC